MRILLTSHYALPHLGGMEVVVDALARRLVERGHDVVLVAASTSADAASTAATATPHRVVRVPAANPLEERFHVPYPLFAPALLGVLRREVARADVVHAQGFLYQPSVAALTLARRRGVPRVLTEHVGHVVYASAALDRLQSLAIASLGRWSARSASALVTMNPKVADELRALAPGRPVELIANGVDTGAFRPPRDDAERAALRRRFGWDDARPRVLFVGRLVAKKGVDVAVAAAGAATGAFELVVAGPGTLPAGAGPDVRALGAVAPAEIALMLRAADAFVLPSRGEGFPVTAQEAMASGLPVVLADDPAYAAHVAGAGAGVRLVPARADAVAEALLALVRDEDARRLAGAAARAHAERAFSWTTAVDRHEALYRALVAARAPLSPRSSAGA